MVLIIWYEEWILNLVLKNGIIFGLGKLLFLLFLLSVFLFMLSRACQFFISGTPVLTVGLGGCPVLDRAFTAPLTSPR